MMGGFERSFSADFLPLLRKYRGRLKKG